MKKLLAILMAAILTLTFAACSKTEGEVESQPDSSSSDSQGSMPTVSSPVPEDVPEESSTDETESSSTPEVSSSAPAASSSIPTETASSSVPVASSKAAEDEKGSQMLVAYFTYAENAELPDGVDASASASIQAWGGATTGNTGLVAHMISEATGSDLFSIQTTKKYPDTYDATLSQGLAELSNNTRPELATHIQNLDNYDVIFLGFPNWGGDMPMALYSFLDEYDLSSKTIVPFVTSGSSGFSGTIRTIEQMEAGATVQEGLSVSGSSAASAQNRVNDWLTKLGYIQ